MLLHCALCRTRAARSKTDQNMRLWIGFLVRHAHNLGAIGNKDGWQNVKDDGRTVSLRKHCLEAPLSELILKFQVEMPQLKIPESVLYDMRPKWLKLFKVGQVDTCTCWSCEDVLAVYRILAEFCRHHKIVLVPVGDRSGVAPLEHADHTAANGASTLLHHFSCTVRITSCPSCAVWYHVAHNAQV